MRRHNSTREIGVSFKEMAASRELQRALENSYWDVNTNVNSGGESRTSTKSMILRAGWFVLKTALFTYFVSRTVDMISDLFESMDPMQSEKKRSKQLRSALEKRLREKGRHIFETNMHENTIAQDLVNPDVINVTFKDIGGLERQKKEIYNLVVLPLKRPELFRGRGKLFRPPSGILLHGVPGTGKTMLAKAIAKESGAAFINLRLSTLMNKFFGESQQLVRALFSLARKLAPTIIFIDEIDGFLRARSMNDHHVNANIKAEFMQLWDGLMTESSEDSNQFGIIIIGATNRVQDIDPAILRRMPRSFHVDLPNENARLSILELTLKDENLSSDFDMAKIASDKITKGFSGADLKELCRAAATRPMQELLESEKRRGSGSTSSKKKDMRPLCTDDFLITRHRDVRPPKEVAESASSSSFSSFSAGNHDSRSSSLFSDLLLSTLIEFHDRQQKRYRSGGHDDEGPVVEEDDGDNYD